MATNYDAVLIVSFGGPEGPGDIRPFLQNVARGKPIPEARLEEVAQRYELFDGVSPANDEIRALLTALLGELNAHAIALPVYWGNRNWHPMLADVLKQMAEDGVRHALAFVTSAFGSYSGCRQYLEDIERARAEVGPEAPQVDKIRVFYNHPGFIEPMQQRVKAALAEVPEDRRLAARVVFTAHSLPETMAANCPYQQQLTEACRLVAERSGVSQWKLAYQSRSGPPSQPWLGPDICDYLRELAQGGDVQDVVAVPIGFHYEHMETVYDLDFEAQAVCDELGMNLVRAMTVGCHPRFVQMVRELIQERLEENPTRLALGNDGPFPDQCPADCCRTES